ncbi:MAG: zinc ribbon domain-containing protein [Desulfobaccales bacterium]
MAGCPYCHTPIRNDAKYCHSCGANLLLPEFDRAFCPQCGARVRSRQWFCQECQSPVEYKGGEDAPAEQILSLQEPNSPPLVTPGTPPRSRNSWIIAGLLSAFLVIPVLVWAIVRITTPALPPSVPKHIAVLKPTQPISLSNQTFPAAPLLPPEGKMPAQTAAVADRAGLQTQAAAVLNNLRAAQLEKDMAKFLKSYASTFPGLDKKQQKTLAIWKKYDYLALHYEMRDFSVVDPKTLTALVRWSLATMNRANQEKEKSTLTYKVWFSQEGGGWRIKQLDPVHNP